MEGAGESAHFTIACEATVSVYFPPGPKPRHWHRLGWRFNASVLLVSLGSSAEPSLPLSPGPAKLLAWSRTAFPRPGADKGIALYVSAASHGLHLWVFGATCCRTRLTRTAARRCSCVWAHATSPWTCGEDSGRAATGRSLGKPKATSEHLSTVPSQVPLLMFMEVLVRSCRHRPGRGRISSFVVPIEQCSKWTSFSERL